MEALSKLSKKLGAWAWGMTGFGTVMAAGGLGMSAAGDMRYAGLWTAAAGVAVASTAFMKLMPAARELKFSAKSVADFDANYPQKDIAAKDKEFVSGLRNDLLEDVKNVGADLSGSQPSFGSTFVKPLVYVAPVMAAAVAFGGLTPGVVAAGVGAGTILLAERCIKGLGRTIQRTALEGME